MSLDMVNCIISRTTLLNMRFSVTVTEYDRNVQTNSALKSSIVLNLYRCWTSQLLMYKFNMPLISYVYVVKREGPLDITSRVIVRLRMFYCMFTGGLEV